MTPPHPLAARFLLDAQDEFLRAIDHIPAPGRGGPLGRLNAAGWVIAHAAWSHDYFVNVLAAGREPDAWAARWATAQREATLAHPLATPYAEAREAYLVITARTTEVAESLDASTFAREIETRYGPSTVGYVICRAPAHLFAHAGELAVIGALVTAPDLDLPGALPHVTGAAVVPSEEADAPAGTPRIVRLLLDAQHEFARVVDAMPQPAAVGSVARVHPGAKTIAEVANHESDMWSTEPRIWSGAAITGRASLDPVPTYDDARSAFRAAVEGSAPVLAALRADDLARPMGDTTIGVEIVRSAALLFARAGELNALASLFGREDLGLPGDLAHVAERTA